MRRTKYYVLDVFTDRALAGNPVAVFPDRSLLAEEELGRIARELNLSETVFVEPSAEPEALCRLRIFTPMSELGMAGHPVVGTWTLLASQGFVDLDAAVADGRAAREELEGGMEKVTFRHELGVGVLPIAVYRSEGRFDSVVMDQARPQFKEPIRDFGEIRAALSVSEEAVSSTGLLPQAVSTGQFILMAPLADRQAMASVSLSAGPVRTLCRSQGCSGIYTFTMDTEESWAFVRARGFFPELGINEDPATGSAAGCLGAYLASNNVLGNERTTAFQIEQGYEIGRPSRISVEVNRAGEEIELVRVSGTAVLVAEAEMILP